MVKREKRDGESNESLMRGFTRAVQSLGFLKEKKKSQYRERKPNKRKLRESAMRKSEKQKERALLIKQGKLEERPQYGSRSSRSSR